MMTAKDRKHDNTPGKVIPIMPKPIWDLFNARKAAEMIDKVIDRIDHTAHEFSKVFKTEIELSRTRLNVSMDSKINAAQRMIVSIIGSFKTDFTTFRQRFIDFSEKISAQLDDRFMQVAQRQDQNAQALAQHIDCRTLSIFEQLQENDSSTNVLSLLKTILQEIQAVKNVAAESKQAEADDSEKIEQLSQQVKGLSDNITKFLVRSQNNIEQMRKMHEQIIEEIVKIRKAEKQCYDEEIQYYQQRLKKLNQVIADHEQLHREINAILEKNRINLRIQIPEQE